MNQLGALRILDRDLGAVSRLFSPGVMDELIRNRHSKYLAEVCAHAGLLDTLDPNLTFAEFTTLLYDVLLARYRCEYVYKNEIANKIVLGRHSINTAQLLSELRVGTSKADLVIINGTSTVYEIKSHYDSLARLAGQLESYSRVFDHINVVVAPSQVDQVTQYVAEEVGVLVLTDRKTLSIVRPSSSNIQNVEQGALFDLLRKSEYLWAIRECFGQVPDVPNTRIHACCRDLFEDVPSEDAHRIAMKVLSQRFSAGNLKGYLDDVPVALKVYALINSLDLRRLQAMAQLLLLPVGQVLCQY